MTNLLAIGLDYPMLQKMKFRGDVIERQFEYASYLNSIHHIIYSPRKLGFSPQKKRDNIHIYPTSSYSEALFYFDALKIARKIIQEQEIDVITTEDPFITGLVGYSLKKRYKIPLNIQIHVDFCDNGYWIEDEIENRFFNQLGKWIVKRADTIRVGTSYEKQKFVRLGTQPEKIHVIPVHSDINKFSQGNGAAIRDRIEKEGFQTLLFSAARITRQKDLPTMIKAMKNVTAKNPDVLLIIAGDGSEKRNIEHLISAEGLTRHIRMIGAIDHSLIPDYLDACDFYLLSSIFEGTCIALAEAAAAGKAAVSSQFAGTYDLIENNRTGLLFPMKDHRAMAEKIIFLLENKKARIEMGRKGKEKIQSHFSRDINIKGLVKLWENTNLHENFDK